MEYIVITLSAILATTFLVYKLTTGLFGFTLRIKPLILCVACAVLISIVLPRIVVGYAGLAGTFVFLLFFAIIFAYFVAYFEEDQPLETIQDSATVLINDEMQMGSLKLAEITCSENICENSNFKQESAELSSCSQIQYSFSTQLPLAAATHKADEFNHTVDTNSSPELIELEQETDDNLALDDSINLSDDIIEQSIIPEAAGIDLKHASILVEEVVSNNLDFLENASANLDLEQNSEKSPEYELGKLDKAVTDVEITAATTNNILEDSQINYDEEIICEPSSSPDLDTYNTETISGEHLNNEITDSENTYNISEDFGDDRKRDYVENISEQDVGGVEDELSKSSLPASDSLDDLIEYAFNQKEQENFNQALYGFYEALKLYPTTKTAPLLVVEIANILKHRGAYDEAIHVFSEGRSLPELQSDAFLTQQFIDTIAYLRIIKNTLMQNRLGSLPYKNIPDLVINEIDKEFRDWKNLS